MYHRTGEVEKKFKNLPVFMSYTCTFKPAKPFSTNSSMQYTSKLTEKIQQILY